MGCGATFHPAVLVAVGGGCLALIGYATVLTWGAESTEAVTHAIRAKEEETKSERRTRWRGTVLWMLPVFVLIGIISAIHVPRTLYVMWVATFIPIGAIDMCHYEHCKGVVTDQPVDDEIQTVNRMAQRVGPILVPLGIVIAVVGIIGAVLASIC